MEPPKLFSEPIKREAWYKQHLSIIQEITKRERPVDKMTIAEIAEMYDERKFLCDTCGEKIEGKNNCTLKEHILHLINPSYLWSCEDCFQDDLRNNRIIATSESEAPVWKDCL
jgi:hypothetical protein